MNSSYDQVKMLIERGADVNAVCHDGSTPLHAACDMGGMEVIEYLLKHGAIPNTKDRQGHTPFSWARCREVKILLIQYGCSPNGK